MKLNIRTLALIALVLIVGGFVLANRFGGATSTGGTATSVTDSSTLGGQPNNTEQATPQESVDHAGDDGSDDAPPLMVQPTDQPDVKEAGSQFAAAWLNAFGQSAQQWRDNLADRSTAELNEEMKDADPQSVPAGAKVGAVTATVQGSLNGADVKVVSGDAKPAELGTLHLTLEEQGGRWLVSEIDWEPVR